MFVEGATSAGSVVYTDEAAAYEHMPARSHWTIKHSAGEYVKRQASTNSIESFWALMKRGLHGTYHHVSVKHLGRYVSEFSGRHNDRAAGYRRPDGPHGQRVGWEAAHLSRPHYRLVYSRVSLSAREIARACWRSNANVI